MPKKKDKDSKADNQVTNYYTKLPKNLMPKYHNPNYKHHLINLPFRCLIVGGSGSMKTNTLVDMIKRMDDTFGNIKFCVKNEQEPLYQFLKQKIPPSICKFTKASQNSPV